MSEKDRFLEAISSSKSGESLQNVKFFLGSARNITQEDLCREAANALRQVSLGAVKPIPSLDSDMATFKTIDFLS